MRVAGYVDVERGQRGSTEEHLTVTQFKVQAEQERLAGLEAAKAAMEAEIETIQEEQKAVQEKTQQAIDRMKELALAVKNMEQLAKEFSDDPVKVLPDAGALESAKSYREKKAKPIFSRIVKVLRSVYRGYIDLRGKFERLQQSYNRESVRTSQMGERIDTLIEENKTLKHIAGDFNRIKKVLGQETIDAALEASRQEEIRRKAPKRRQKEYSR